MATKVLTKEFLIIQYINMPIKKITSIKRTERIKDQAVMLEKLCASHTKESVLAMEKLLHNLSKFISPVVCITFEIINQHGSVSFFKMSW